MLLSSPLSLKVSDWPPPDADHDLSEHHGGIEVKFDAIVTLLLASVVLSAGDMSSGQGSDDVKVLKTRQKDFEVVWQTIAESYFDPAFGGVDWKRVRQQYEPKLPSVKSDEEFYGLLNNMLSELGRSHLSVIPG